jgi:hypothetical protein
VGGPSFDPIVEFPSELGRLKGSHLNSDLGHSGSTYGTASMY